MTILIIDAGIFGKKTEVLAENVQTYLHKYDTDFSSEIVYFKEYQHEILDGRPFQAYNEAFQQLIQKIENATGYVIISPIFQGSIPGTLKNVLDFIHPKALRYKPVAILGNGGTSQHHLVIEHQLKPILDYFRCFVTPNYTYTQRSHFDENNHLIDEEIHERLQELVRVFLAYTKMSEQLREETFID